LQVTFQWLTNWADSNFYFYRCLSKRSDARVARWFVFKPKIPILEGLWLENAYIFYGHLEYFMEIWDILRPSGTFCAHLVHFFRFWYHVPRKIWQPCLTCVGKGLIFSPFDSFFFFCCLRNPQ
jgi:hypothetical protein